MKTLTFEEWWQKERGRDSSNKVLVNHEDARIIWDTALANAPQPTWLKREKDSECQPPFALLDYKDGIGQLCFVGKSLFYYPANFDLYCPLPPLPKQKDEAEVAWEQRPGSLQNISLSEFEYIFNLGRAKAKQ